MQLFSAAPGFYFFVTVLAVWRLTHLLLAEDGPFDVIVSLRRACGKGFFGQLMDCFYCLSLWTAAPAAFVLAQRWLDGLLLWFALSASAILFERVHAVLIAHEQQLKPMPFFEEDAFVEKTPHQSTGDADELLRK
jgi:hypothetical protein